MKSDTTKITDTATSVPASTTPEFVGPAAFAWGYRFAADERDAQRKNRAKLYSGEHGIWDCTRCMFCNERCPKGVDPRDAIEKLGAIAFQEKVTKDKGARHAKAFLISMRTGGKLNEQLVGGFTDPVGGAFNFTDTFGDLGFVPKTAFYRLSCFPSQQKS